MTKTQRERFDRILGTGSNSEKYDNLKDASHSGALSDETNPIFMFSTCESDILVLIAQGKIDPVWFAKKELANRGQNTKGQWVWFVVAGNENFK